MRPERNHDGCHSACPQNTPSGRAPRVIGCLEHRQCPLSLSFGGALPHLAIPDAGENACPGAGCQDYAIAPAVMKPPTVALTDPTRRLRRLMENSSSLLIVLGI